MAIYTYSSWSMISCCWIFLTKLRCLWRWKATGSFPYLLILVFMSKLWLILNRNYPFNFSTLAVPSFIDIPLLKRSAISCVPPFATLSNSFSTIVYSLILSISLSHVSSHFIFSSAILSLLFSKIFFSWSLWSFFYNFTSSRW